MSKDGCCGHGCGCHEKRDPTEELSRLFKTRDALKQLVELDFDIEYVAPGTTIPDLLASVEDAIKIMSEGVV